MKKITVIQELEALVKHFKDVYRIDASAIDAVHERMRNAKKDLDDILQLNEGNNYRKEIDVTFTEAEFLNAYPSMTKAIIAYFSDLYSTKLMPGSDISFTGNYICHAKNNLKISKLINKDIDVMWAKVIEPHLNSIQKQLTYRVDKKNFVTALFSLTKCGTVFISTNVVDFLMSSNPDWGNCMRVEGSHYNGVTSYTNDSFTVVIFSERSASMDPVPADGKRYAGRAWTYVFPKEGTIVTPVSYGNLSIPYVKAARLYMEKCIAERYQYPHKWRIYKRDKYPEFDKSKATYGGGDNQGSYPIYFDGAKPITVAMNKKNILDQLTGTGVQANDEETEFESEMLIKHPYMGFKSAVCLKCGREHMSREKPGLCSSSCNGRKLCDICGKYHYASAGERSPKGFNYVCPTCLSTKFVTCSCCNDLIFLDKSNIHDVSKDKSNRYKALCEKCYVATYKTCSGCGSVVEPGDLHSLDADKYCSKCMSVFTKNNLIFNCSCGSTHVIDTVCSQGGILKVTKPVPGKNLKEILDSPVMIKARESNSIIDIMDLDADMMEAYFVSRLMTEVLNPSFAQQLITLKYDASLQADPVKAKKSSDDEEAMARLEGL